MPIYSMSTTDAEPYLKSVGVNPPEQSNGYPEFELMQVRYTDLDPKTSKPKEGRETRGICNGSCFQYEKEDDAATFLKEVPICKSARREMMTTMLMIDPDAPDRVNKEGDCAGANGPYLHWLVTDVVTTTKNSGETKCPYMGPDPPKGKHRYIFVEFEQPNPVVVTSIQREKWDFKGFLAANPTLKCVAIRVLTAFIPRTRRHSLHPRLALLMVTQASRHQLLLLLGRPRGCRGPAEPAAQERHRMRQGVVPVQSWLGQGDRRRPLRGAPYRLSIYARQGSPFLPFPLLGLTASRARSVRLSPQLRQRAGRRPCTIVACS